MGQVHGLGWCLRAFAAREGHARPRPTTWEGELPLGRWVIVQRAQRKTGKLTEARANGSADCPAGHGTCAM